MIRKILAIVLGLVAGSVINMAIVSFSNFAYPYPAEIDPSDFEAVRAHLELHGMPFGEMMLVLLAHGAGSFASGLVCGIVAGRPWYSAAIGLGVLWTCGGISMLLLLPAPIWFAVIDLLLYIPSALLGTRLAGRRSVSRLEDQSPES